MKPKKNQRKHGSQKRSKTFDPACQKQQFCDPGACSNCQYIGDGDFLCDKNNVVVVSDWEPTDDYMSCRSHSSFRPKERKQKPAGRKGYGRTARGQRHG